MKGRILLTLTLLIVLSSTLLAFCPEVQEDCLADFDKNPTPDNFKLIENPTAAQLAKIPNPEPWQFNRLSIGEQGNYIDNLAVGDYSQSGNRMIAHRFFSQAISNVNDHKEAFKRYLEEVRQVDIVEFRGDLVGFNADGTLKGKDQSLNINDYKKNAPLGKLYKLTILDGVIYLIPRRSTIHVPFTGDLKKGPDGKLALKEGSLNGKKIKSGTGLSLDKEGKIRGKAKEFSGISFASAETLFEYTKDKNLLILDNAEIESVDKGVSSFVAGKVRLKDFDKIKGNLVVPSEKSLVLNGFDIKSKDKNIDLRFGSRGLLTQGKEEGNFVRFSDGVKIGGEGFTMAFSPAELSTKNLDNKNPERVFIKLPGRGYYKIGDRPPEGSVEKIGIENIQRLIGTTDDGVYGPATTANVKKWQEKVYKQTGECLGKSTSSGCVADGLFGPKSAEFVNRGTFLSTKKNIVFLSPQGGEAEFSLDKEGLKADFRGKVDFKVGNKKMSFDGKSLYKEVIKSTFNTELMLPTELSFYGPDGNKIGETIKTQGTDTFYSKGFDERKMYTKATLRGVDPEGSQCSKAASAIFNEQGPEGVKYGGLFDSTLASAAGVEGDAWEMSLNMQEKGGSLVFFIEQDQLAPEQTAELNKIAYEMRIRFEEGMVQINSEYGHLKEINPEFYAEKVDELRKSVSEEFREREGNILNKQLTGQVAVGLGDVVSFYYKDSGYLSKAMIESKGGQKNTHVGVIKSFKEEEYNLIGVSNPTTYLQKQLKVKNMESLYVNQYYIQQKGEKDYEPASFREGKFYLPDGTEVTAMDRIIIKRPQVAHMIHYGAEKNPFHLENLDQTLDRDSLSLYAVTRPAEEFKDKIAQAKLQKDEISVAPIRKSCQSSECQALNPLDKAGYVGADNEVITALEKTDYSKVPSHQKNLFQAAVLAVIEMEGGGAKYYQNIIENNVAFLFSTEDLSQGTYSQVKPSTLQEAGKITGKETAHIDLTTDEGSIEGTAIVMEAIFKKYIPPNKKTLTEEDLRVIAAAWHVGIDAEYTRKLAAGDYAHLPKVKSTSIKGFASEYWTKFKGYDTTAYFNAYPERYKEAYENYCC